MEMRTAALLIIMNPLNVIHPSILRLELGTVTCADCDQCADSDGALDEYFPVDQKERAVRYCLLNDAAQSPDSFTVGLPDQDGLMWIPRCEPSQIGQRPREQQGRVRV